jgi:hypothetical protein
MGAPANPDVPPLRLAFCDLLAPFLSSKHSLLKALHYTALLLGDLLVAGEAGS